MKRLKRENSEVLINYYNREILDSKGMNMEKDFIQHGDTSVYEHSLSVAIMCLKIADVLKLNVKERELIRGALLHDYFLYDWHDHDEKTKWHGFTHARKALMNASSEYDLSDVEKNMILSHMFPLNMRVPKYKESVILCIADKICATKEVTGYQMDKIKQFVKYMNM